MCSVGHASFANTVKEWRSCPWGGMSLQTAVSRHWIQKQQETGFLLKEKTVGAPEYSVPLVNSSPSHVREQCPFIQICIAYLLSSGGRQEGRQPFSQVLGVNIPSLYVLRAVSGSFFHSLLKYFVFHLSLLFHVALRKIQNFLPGFP